MACARLGRLRAPAMAFALRRELVRLGHRLFGAGTAYGAPARLVRRRLVAGADRAAACGRGLAIDPPWARTGERHAGRRGYWGTCTCCDPRFRDWLEGLGVGRSRRSPSYGRAASGGHGAGRRPRIDGFPDAAVPGAVRARLV